MRRNLQDTNSSTTPVVRYAKNMDPNVMPDVKLYTIEEDYPDPNNKNL